MNLFTLLICSAVVGTFPGGFVKDSFIRDNVEPKDFPTLTQRAKRGKTHLSGSGSGFFVTADGYLLTNHHVVEDAAEVVVVKGNAAYLADVVSKSKDKDIALLKINLFPRATNGVYNVTINGKPKIPFLSLMTYPEVGMEIYAIGFPRTGVLGWEPKVTRGIVGALSGANETADMIQVDLSIDHGNSGGPIVDEYGFVVGMATSGYSLRANHNFAVKAKTMEAQRRKAEAEARKLAREREEAEERKRQAEREAKELERERQRKEMREKAEEERRNKAMCREIAGDFRKATCLFASDLKKNAGKFDKNEIVYLVGEDYLTAKNFYKLECQGGKIKTAHRISEREGMQELSESDMNAVTDCKRCIILRENGVVEFWGTGSNVREIEASSDDSISPLDIELAELSAELSTYVILIERSLTKPNL